MVWQVRRIKNGLTTRYADFEGFRYAICYARATRCPVLLRLAWYCAACYLLRAATLRCCRSRVAWYCARRYRLRAPGTDAFVR
eukprot:3628143-Rhodomonas_salina.3